MKKTALLTLLIVAYSCNENPFASSQKSEPAVVYDSIKAKAYGADPYGMKKYVVVFLTKGSNRDLEPLEEQKLQIVHLKNIERMAAENKLVLAGPFVGDGDIRGVYIFNVESIEEAEALTNSDPAIQSGSLQMELKEWYGSAALMAINEIHNTLSQKNIAAE